MSQAHILVVDDEPDIRHLVSEILEDEGYRVTVAENGQSARAAFTKNTPDLVLLDIWMPDIDGILLLKEWSGDAGLPCPVIVMSGHGSVETAVEATRLGAHDFVQKPISLAKLISVVSQALATRKPAAEGTRRSPAAASIEPLGTSPAARILRNRAEQAAQHESPVLITGEPGSGRESLARFIHDRSHRPGRFVAIDHGQLEGQNLRAHILGSDQEGNRRAGVFEQALQGSLLFGDLHEIPGDAQKIILQVLESGQYVREGGSSSQAVDCRLMASGCDDLISKARGEPVLEQLFYRLNVLPLAVPPLRERPEDIPVLVRFYADWFPNNEGLPYRSFSVSAQNRLRNHDWPGNVRELRNLVQRLLVLGGDGDVTVAEVEEALQQNPAAPAGEDRPPEIFKLPLREAREQFEREYLSYQLQQARGSVGKLAESVGMERTHLYRKLRALGIDPKSVVKQGASK